MDTESRRGGIADASASLLQWGRVRVDTERVAHLTEKSKETALQWGRVRVDTERSKEGAFHS